MNTSPAETLVSALAECLLEIYRRICLSITTAYFLADILGLGQLEIRRFRDLT